jgi:thymidylate synthase (FAD)
MVYVLAASRVNEKELRDFLTDEGFENWDTAAVEDGEKIVEVAGRVCYLSFAGGRSHDQYIEHLKESRHGSVLEHATITFIITGISRACTHEFVRHRAGWSYSQLSQRFVDEGHAQMVRPRLFDKISRIDDRERLHRLWEDFVKGSVEVYNRFVTEFEWLFNPPHAAGKIDLGLKKAIKGAARSVLPNATETKLVATCNARALRHFLEMRAGSAADSEIRAVAIKLYQAALQYWPDILGDYQVIRTPDGEEYLTTHYEKV